MRERIEHGVEPDIEHHRTAGTRTSCDPAERVAHLRPHSESSER
jgi:hypothetical protein